MEKKRETYEEMYAKRKREIDRRSGIQLDEYRERLKAWRIQTIELYKEFNIKESRLRYLQGMVKHVIDPLLNYTKERKATLNRVIHDGGNNYFFKRFYEQAFELLPLYDFQRICGRAVQEEEIEAQTIEDIKEFMRSCKAMMSDKNGNVL